ncbi:MAG: type II toxin-antitoxin system PemK/MazF family toxin [Candidatus Poribacteria bacterium]
MVDARERDFIILSFDPQSGHKQKAYHPAIVVSKTLFNRYTLRPYSISRSP